jgi:serine/threonine protein kinase
MSTKFNRYEIEAEIGRGGMATVYRAYDPLFKRSVAIKVLPHELLHNTTFRARFEREAQTVAALEHPAIVPVHDFGEQDGQPFLVMRYMTGGTLADRLVGGAMPVSEAARILNRLAPALDSAHSLGIIHRDLKPGNILFDQWNEPYLSDFGIVKLAEGQEATLTATGGVVGTPAYMSPEQVMGGVELDGRSDIFALGIILYEMLTGRRPYEADTPMALAFKHVNAPLPRIRDGNPKLSPRYQSVIERALAKDRTERYGTAAALAGAVVKLAQEESTLESSGSSRLAGAIQPAEEETRIESVPQPSVAKVKEAFQESAPVTEASWQETAIEPRPVPIQPQQPVPRVDPAPPPSAFTPAADKAVGVESTSRRSSTVLLGAAGLLAALVFCVAGLVFTPHLLNRGGDQEDVPAVASPVYEAGVVSGFIEQKWAEGYAISSLAYGWGAWTVIMSAGEGDQQQAVKRQPTLPADFIDRKWSEGFEITSLTYGDNQWVVVMTRGVAPQRQVLTAEPLFPRRYIDQKWAEGFDLAHVAYGNGLWAVVMSQGLNDLRQSLSGEPVFPREFIDQKWAEGFEITSLAYGNDEWVVVMSDGVGALRQTVWRDAEFPRRFVEERWAQGYEITSLAYGAGQWAVVMSQGVGPLRQTLRTGGW